MIAGYQGSRIDARSPRSVAEAATRPRLRWRQRSGPSIARFARTSRRLHSRSTGRPYGATHCASSRTRKRRSSRKQAPRSSTPRRSNSPKSGDCHLRAGDPSSLPGADPSSDGTVVRQHAPRTPGTVAGVASERDVLVLQTRRDIDALLELLDARGVSGKQLHTTAVGRGCDGMTMICLGKTCTTRIDCGRSSDAVSEPTRPSLTASAPSASWGPASTPAFQRAPGRRLPARSRRFGRRDRDVVVSNHLARRARPARRERRCPAPDIPRGDATRRSVIRGPWRALPERAACPRDPRP